MEFKGLITEISKIKKGTTKKGDPYASLDVEVTESNPDNPQYPQIASFSYFKMGEYVKFAEEFNKNFTLNDEVTVEFSFKCQKYVKDGVDKKFYKNDAWKITKTENSTTNNQAVAVEETGDLPF